MSPRFIVVMSSILGLVACAQSGYDWSAETLPPPNLVDLANKDKPGSPASLRVIVQFHAAVAGDDPEVLQTLQTQAQGLMRFLSAVSMDTHVYSLQLPPGQDAARALQRLSASPTVKRVELDQAVKIP